MLCGDNIIIINYKKALLIARSVLAGVEERDSFSGKFFGSFCCSVCRRMLFLWKIESQVLRSFAAFWVEFSDCFQL